MVGVGEERFVRLDGEIMQADVQIIVDVAIASRALREIAEASAASTEALRH